MRRTKIIATLGPATDSPEMLGKLLDAGMDIARLNMSHAPHEWARRVVRDIRDAASARRRAVGIMMDTQGPAIRTGDLPAALDLQPGQTFTLTVRGQQSEELHSVDVNYENFLNDISVGDIVLLDNGQIHMKVLAKDANKVECEVLTPGKLGSRRHINLPGVRVSLPALTAKDLADLKFGLAVGLDYVALSFVREAKDILQLRQVISQASPKPLIIAKIEDQLAVQNFEEILREADGIMVARGDLGIECPYEELPIIQRRIVKTCLEVGRPVIVATHMLESMIENPLPTRAEITDVANAVFEQADAIMLSGETSLGRYPVECVRVLNRVALRIERSGGAGYAESAILGDKRQKTVASAVVLANSLPNSKIIVFTRHGAMAQNVSKLRPENAPIFAFTSNEEVYRQLSICWGVYPVKIDFTEDPNATIEAAEKFLRATKLTAPGDQLVIISDLRAGEERIDSVQLRTAK